MDVALATLDQRASTGTIALPVFTTRFGLGLDQKAVYRVVLVTPLVFLPGMVGVCAAQFRISKLDKQDQMRSPVSECSVASVLGNSLRPYEL